MRLFSLRIPGLLGVLLQAMLRPADAVVINEIFHHPPGTNLLEQWFELRNPGTNTVDLSGWRVSGDVEFSIPTNTALARNGYLVVAADAATFARRHPAVTNFVAGWTGVLNHHLKLSNATNTPVNSVDFYAQGDWAVRVIGAPHFNHRGWEWSAAHDGGGASLELVNGTLPNTFAHNWESSVIPDGTPGQANSVARTNTAPFITEVAHRPTIPLPSDPVTVSARIVDERTSGLTVALHWRVDGATAFTSEPMTDDGGHDDGAVSDGIFGAILPPQPHGTVVEFYLTASDLDGYVRAHPAFEPPTNSSRTANLLYQVDHGTYSGAQPVYRVIMREIERAELYQLGRQFPDADSDAEMNATWISTDGVMTDGTTKQLRYNASVRNRGHGTRVANPNNYHVNLPDDRAWKGVDGINLNAHYGYSQVLGSAIFRRLEVPIADSRPAQVRINSTNLMVTVGSTSFGFYAANEQYDNDFVKRTWPEDSRGNSYRALRGPTEYGTRPEADLTWQGADFFVPDAYTNAYFKQNNFLANDHSDLVDLIAVLNSTNGYAASNYVRDVRQRLNVEQWMRYMAINTLLANGETCLANGVGDDYALYRGTNDTRFVVLPYDLDTVMGRGQSVSSPRDGIWRMTAVAAMDRFMRTPEFAPVYFRQLRSLAGTAFASAQMDGLIEQVLGADVPRTTRDNFKAFNASHVAYVLSQIPLTLAVSNALTFSNTYPYTIAATLPLNGSANAADTRRVLVNGTVANYVAWQGTWSVAAVSLKPGINRILIQTLDENDVEVGRIVHEVWHDDGSAPTVGGTINADTTWSAAGGPYHVASSVTVNSGVTLTIEAGTTLYLGAGYNITVNSGGRLLAEGDTNAPILFTRIPGSTNRWGGITILGAAGTPETRITYAHLEFNGSTAIHSVTGAVFLDHLTFGSTDRQYVSLDASSFVVSHCHFPTATARFELLHGTGGIKSGGHGIFRHNFFGAADHYNDVIDFTGGNRPGQPILHFLNNVFIGSDDDLLDLDGTDAWIEGNIFLHCHRNGAPDSSSAVSGGNTGGDLSEVTIVGNLFYDCDHAATAKQGNFYTLLNNTVVLQTHQGGVDTDGAVVNFVDEGTTEGAGAFLEGNIIYDAEKLLRGRTSAMVTCTNNLMPFAWTGTGGGNSPADPRLKYVPQFSETTNFTSWEQAQVLWDWFSLQPGSPARGNGPNGRDQGAVIPRGVFLSGEPAGTNRQTTATLAVGFNRSGNGIPSFGFPNGSGYVAYRYRLDEGDWSGESPISTPIFLSGLANGPHRVDVSGKRDSGLYQDDPLFGEDALVTPSRVWFVDPNYQPPTLPTVRLNEVLAVNQTTLTNAGATPDLIELHNYGSSPAVLTGMGLSDSADQPYKFTFPANTTLGAGAYLVLYADSATAAPGLHLGFSLKASGDDLYLRDSVARGGGLVDALAFGVQIPDASVGRVADGAWTLCQPTFGGANLAGPLAGFAQLRINEWLTDAQFAAPNDFVELFNPDPRPAPLGDLFLSDAAGSPERHRIAPLSFIGGGGFTAFIADGDWQQGADHLGFKLSPEVGMILLSAPDLTLIDAVNYGSQRTDVSQGRSPSGSNTITTFPQPTRGAANPRGTGFLTLTNVTQTVWPLVDVGTTAWRWDDSGTNQGTAWRVPAFNDGTWSNDFGLFGRETTPQIYPYPFQTAVRSPSQGGRMTVYYRTHFNWSGGITNFQLVATNYVDDGAVFYLNGQEADRLRVSANPVLYTSTAADQANEAQPEIRIFPATNLVTGDNVLAVEVHQARTDSSDDVFGLSLSAIRFTTNVVTQTLGVPVVLNEVLAANRSLTNSAGHTADYVELHNPTTNSLDLSELSLSNDANTPRKWAFPTNTWLAPLGYSVVCFDDAAPASSTNTGFALSAQGDVVYLFDRPAAGGALLDAIRFGLQTPDHAVGRVPDGGGNWALTVPSPGALNSASGLGSISALRINEWMAAPASGDDWFEVFNAATEPVALGGLFLTDKLTDITQSPIGPLNFIGAGADGYIQFIADGNANAGAHHVNFSLKQSGEALGLFSPSGVMLDGMAFGAQAVGVSQGRFPDVADRLVSFATTASPGEANYLPLPNAVISEVLTHTDPPLEDAVELFNPTPALVNIGGWYLSNSKADLKKYRIPDGTLLPADGFAVIYEAAFNTGALAFTFNSAHGDSAILSEADALGNLTGYRSEVTFGAVENGVSMGRYATSVGMDFTALATRTFGQDHPGDLVQFRSGNGLPNAAPKVGPVVISEIGYYPTVGGVENAEDEFVELENISAGPVALYDPAFPTNTWRLRDAVDFVFPTNLTVVAGARLVVVGFPPTDAGLLADFRAQFNVPAEVSVFGPWNGRLANDSDSVELVKPDLVQLAPHPDAGFVPQVLVDKVRYQASLPWPAPAANGSNSLQRIAGSAYGNDPVNWLAAAPTPGRAAPTGFLDADGDEMDDHWELAYFLTLARNGNGDWDADGMPDRDEYRAGTSPADPTDALELHMATVGAAALQFNVVPGKTYTVQYRDTLGTGPWQKLADVPAQTSPGVMTVPDPAPAVETRYYRIVTPAQP